MVPREFLLSYSILIVGLLGSLCAGNQDEQQQNHGQGDDKIKNAKLSIFDNVDHLIAEETRNGQKRSNKKSSKSDGDEYHEVYVSKPKKYSRSYHHEDNYRDAPKTKTYGNSDGGYGGSASRARDAYSHNPYRRKERRNKYKQQRDDDDYDDYQESPKHSKPFAEDYDYDSSGDTRRDKGYAHNEDYDRSRKDDYHKAGELKDDFEEFGREGSRNYQGRERSGRGSKGGRGRDSYSNSNSDDEIGDSDYVDDGSDGFASQERKSSGEKREIGERDENPLDKYEQITRKALKTYGTLDGTAFLSSL